MPTRARRVGSLDLVSVLILAALITSAVVTLGAPLIPIVQTHFGVTPELAQWSYTVTLLVGATVTPILGRMADGRHRRVSMIWVCLLVAAGCLISAAAPSFEFFLAGRALQGLGVSLVAMTIAVARDHVPSEKRVRVVALLSVTTAIGAGISYPVTTAVVEHLGLAAAFGGAAFLSFVVSLVAMAGLPRTAFSGPAARLDLPGALLLVLASGLGLLGISQGNRWGWLDARIAVLGVCSVVLLAAWLHTELRAVVPLVQLRLMKHRNVAAANVTAVLMGVSLYSTPALIGRVGLAPQSTGYGAGLTLTAIGLIMLPISFGNVLGNRLAASLTCRLGPRVSLALGGAVAALGPLVLTVGGAEPWQLVVAISLSAVGAGATFGAMPNLIVASVVPGETGSATSLNILLRTVGGAVGSAATAALLGANAGTVSGLPQRLGFQHAYLFCAGACLLSVVTSLTVPARRVTDVNAPLVSANHRFEPGRAVEPLPRPRCDRPER